MCSHGKGSNGPKVRLSLGEAGDGMLKAEVEDDNRKGRQQRVESTACGRWKTRKRNE